MFGKTYFIVDTFGGVGPRREIATTGNAFVWVAYYGDNEDVEGAAKKIDSVITELQEEHVEAES